MESDLLSVSVSSRELQITSHVEESPDAGGLHELTADGLAGSEIIMGELAGDQTDQNVITLPALSTDISSSVIEKDGEITLHSSLIPENAVLMETSRGLMLTVPDMGYGDMNSPNESSSRPLLSCIPVSFFKTCDNTTDGETNIVYSDVSVINGPGDLQQDLNEDGETASHVQVGEAVMKEEICTSVIDSLESPQQANQQQPVVSEETTEVCVTMKRKGGWPKGKKRKNKPVVTGPRAPVTGYMLYAMDRRKEIKQSHPEVSFPEVTKILGQEWSSMSGDEKEKYLKAAESDKKRYMEELKAFRSSEVYQETVRKKLLLQGGSSENTGTDVVPAIDDDETSNELHCKVCNVYFSSGHNKREHMYGKTHLQAVTEAVEKDILRQQQEEHGLVDSALVVSEEASQDCFSDQRRSLQINGNQIMQSGPVDIHGFMMEFIQKNYEREQEISLLKRNLNKSLQDNLMMCKEIQELQEYQSKLQEELKSLTTTTTSLIVQNDALKMVPTLFGVINL